MIVAIPLIYGHMLHYHHQLLQYSVLYNAGPMWVSVYGGNGLGVGVTTTTGHCVDTGARGDYSSGIVVARIEQCEAE